MRNLNRRGNLTKLAGAVALLVAGLALLSPGLPVIASLVPEHNPQQPQQDVQPQGERAPSQRIEPTSVSVINFRKLAEADARAGKTRRVSGEQTHSDNAAPLPMTIPETEAGPVAPSTTPST